MAQRVVALVDMDCFYCQVEARLNPGLAGKPVAVVQYNQWKGGGIIAMNYEAKEKGVVRGMRGADAMEICPDINLVSVPTLRGKADLTKYREAGEEVAAIFSIFSDQIQRASIDEAYIDLTKAVKNRLDNGPLCLDESFLKSSYIVGFSELNGNNEEKRIGGVRDWLHMLTDHTSDSPDLQLAIGGMIVEEMREQILLKTGFHCSAGIAHNKTLAKLIAGLHKPKHQTILPQDCVPELYNTLPIYKIKNLGGKFGQYVSEKLSIKYMSEMYKYSLKELQQLFDEKSGKWLYNIARGIDTEQVTLRLIPQSIGCCKNFPGKTMLATKEDVKHWVRELADEISERLKQDLLKNKRRAKLLTISFSQKTATTKSAQLRTYETDSIANIALNILNKFNNATSSTAWDPPIKFLGLSAAKFFKEVCNLNKFLTSVPAEKEVSGAIESQGSDIDLKTEYSNVERIVPRSEAVDNNAKMVYIKSRENEEKNSAKSFFLSFLNSRTTNLKNEVCKSAKYECNNSGECRTASAAADVSVKSSNLLERGIYEDKPWCSVESESSDPQNGAGALPYETTICEQCNESIGILDFFEHLDYHVAAKLQSELNKEARSIREAPIVQNITESDVKNKRKRLGNSIPAAKKVRDIKSFFQVVTK